MENKYYTMIPESLRVAFINLMCIRDHAEINNDKTTVEHADKMVWNLVDLLMETATCDGES